MTTVTVSPTSNMSPSCFPGLLVLLHGFIWTREALGAPGDVGEVIETRSDAAPVGKVIETGTVVISQKNLLEMIYRDYNPKQLIICSKFYGQQLVKHVSCLFWRQWV